MGDPAEEKIQAKGLVRDYMTTDPQALEASQSLLDTALLLRTAGLRHIPILENGKLVGILSDRDMARATPSMLKPLPQQEYNQIFEETRVERIMTHDPKSTRPDAPLAEAAAQFSDNHVGCLPVLEEGRLVGILTISDLIRVLRDFLG